MISDETLYYNYFNGDESGLTGLMERYSNSLTNYIYGYLHDIHDSEDLMIEAFAYIIIKKPQIRETCLKAYIYKSARHLALRFLSKKRLSRCCVFEDMECKLESEIFIEEVIQKNERNRTLHLCLEQLNANYREALYLVYFENMRHAEVAIIMGKSEKQVADLIYRGKNSIRKKLGQVGINSAEY
jgi:RNA polymerase sigma-70 factor (ECF subfamily)